MSSPSGSGKRKVRESATEGSNKEKKGRLDQSDPAAKHPSKKHMQGTEAGDTAESQGIQAPAFRTKLLSHQFDGFKRGMLMEDRHPPSTPGISCLWENLGERGWKNIVTNEIVSLPPHSSSLPKGGIIADDHGMGKTATGKDLVVTISLVIVC
jgi:hypothetical protein